MHVLIEYVNTVCGNTCERELKRSKIIGVKENAKARVKNRREEYGKVKYKVRQVARVRRGAACAPPPIPSTIFLWL